MNRFSRFRIAVLVAGLAGAGPAAASGTLTDGKGRVSQLTNAATDYRAREIGSQESCESNLNAPGSGELVFAQDPLGFSVVENRVAGTAALSYTGMPGGSASGVAGVTGANPQQVAQQCPGAGMASAPVSVTLQTTPTMSG